MIPYFIQLPQYIDSRGKLVACDGEHDIYFPIERAFWMTHVPGDAVRGGHAHRECHQLLIAVHGALDVETCKQTFHLSRSHIGLHVPPGNYITIQNFTPNTVLLVLCSHHFDKEDYIHDKSG